MVTPQERIRVKKTINAGLVVGWGQPVAGETSLAGAICIGLSIEFEAQPAIIADPDYVFAMRLHDAFDGTPAERAELFVPIGLAMLATAQSDRSLWAAAVARGCVERVLPLAFRAVGGAELLAAALDCEADPSEAKAHAAKVAARGVPILETTAACAAKALWRGDNVYGAAKDAAKAACAGGNATIAELVAVALDAYSAEKRG